MVFDSPNNIFEHNGAKLKVGSSVKCVADCPYKNFFGTIIEIRTDADKTTNSTEPEICCSFKIPLRDNDCRKIENRLKPGSALKEVSVMAVVSPSMIRNVVVR